MRNAEREERATDDLPGVPLTMTQLLLYSGWACHDASGSDEGRAKAKRVFDELIACAAAHGFRSADRLRTLMLREARKSPKYVSPASFPSEAFVLADAALGHVPADAIRKALARAGASGLLMGDLP